MHERENDKNNSPNRDPTWDRFTSHLEQCPMCNYPLNGLPVRHHCPECGFEYGPDTAAWKPAGLLGYFGVSLISYLCVLAAVYVSAWLSPLSAIRIAFLYVVMAIWGALILRNFMQWQNRPVMVIDRRALRLSDQRASWRILNWTDISTISSTIVGRRPYTRIVLTGDRSSVDVTSWLGRNADSHDRFVLIARAYGKFNTRISG